jgi:ribose/xylose/arabinose/galactoside ABC-type transport system permease subunit
MMVKPLNRNYITQHKNTILVYIILAGLFIFASLATDVFLSSRNLKNVLGQAVVLGLVATGQTFVILGGGIDLSVGSIISLTSCLATGLMMGRDPLALPVVGLVIVIALFIGAVNGLLIVRTGIPPLIVTLGMMEILQGIVLMYTDAPYGEIAPSLSFIAWGQIGGVPFSILFLGILIGFGIFVLKRLPVGRHLYAIGGNEETARLSAINTGRIKIYTYMTCSFMAGLCGLFMATRMGMGDPVGGEPFMLDSLVPVLIGGTSLVGGKGGLVGTLGGIFIITILHNALNLLDVSGYWQWIIQGFIILVAVAIYIKEKF